MGATIGSSVGVPTSGPHRAPVRRLAARLAGVAAIAVSALVAFFALGVAGLDTGAWGLPALALGVVAVVLSIVLVDRGRPALALVVAVVSVPVVSAAIVAGGAVGESYACSDGERNALRQVEHLSRVQPGIAGYLEGSGCIVRYSTNADPKAVLQHYVESLSGKGWDFTSIQPYGPKGASGDAYATRGALSIWISWLPEKDASTRVIVSLHD